ncbi:MAG: polymer-forming cytoskeletal protein [Rhodospirillaceae bacterium]
MFGKKKSDASDKTVPDSKTESDKKFIQNNGNKGDSTNNVEADDSLETSAEVGSLPLGDNTKSISPPLKPFKKDSPMSNPPSSSYRPEIPRKVVDIPNPSRLPSERSDSSGDEDGKRLVVGKSISVSGDISACETLVVQGTVEANMSDAVTLEVSEGGLFKGEAEVDHAYIAGTFDGTLRARLTLEVAESGHVKGSINYNNISIASGGRVQGTIDVIDADKR